MPLPPKAPRPKRSGRKRRLAGRFLLAIGVLITGVWGASRWWWMGAQWAQWRLGCDGGLLYVAEYRTQSPSGPSLSARRRGPVSPDQSWYWLIDERLIGSASAFPPSSSLNVWIVGYERFDSPPSFPMRTAVLMIPWPFALASLLGGGLLLWSGLKARRRAMTGHCLKCGYDLSGLAPGIPCPECGGLSKQL
ncbi:MAG: hypothetical protein ACREJO_00505 [Phycisphaerales bacterium]